MRHLLPGLLIALTACSADPVLLPDAGPCNGSCGAGTVCVAGACVGVDGGGVDVPGVDAGGMDVQRVDVVDVFVATDPAPIVDRGAVDAGTDAPVADTYGACLDFGIRECDGRNVFIQGGERDGGPDSGRYYHCGGCGITCAVGEVCFRCLCQR